MYELISISEWCLLIVTSCRILNDEWEILNAVLYREFFMYSSSRRECVHVWWRNMKTRLIELCKLVIQLFCDFERLSSYRHVRTKDIDDECLFVVLSCRVLSRRTDWGFCSAKLPSIVEELAVMRVSLLSRRQVPYPVRVDFPPTCWLCSRPSSVFNCRKSWFYLLA